MRHSVKQLLSWTIRKGEFDNHILQYSYLKNTPYKPIRIVINIILGLIVMQLAVINPNPLST